MFCSRPQILGVQALLGFLGDGGHHGGLILAVGHAVPLIGALEHLGIVKEGRLVVLFTLETDLGDGWEDPEVHNDPENRRQEALRMGANIISYVFSN